MKNPGEVDLIIFDTDGTIIPSLETVYEGIRKTFAAFGWELEHSIEDINQYIGLASGELYKNIVPPPHRNRWEELRDRARAEYAALFQKSAATFPGVKETLGLLRKRGFNLALYSNATTSYFNNVISSLQIRDYFDYAECVHDNNLTKPELVRKIKEKLYSTTTAIVGDRIHDIEAARETDSLSIGVLFGYGGEEPERADITIKQFDELLDIFDRKLPVFEKIINEINERKEKDKPFVVGITGIDGAGKTKFAVAFERYLLTRNYQTQMIHLDDFHNPRAVRYAGEDEADNYYYRSFNLDEIINKLLIPCLQSSKYSIKKAALNLETDKYDVNKEYNFNPNTIIILEGVFLLRDELSQYIDCNIFLEIPFNESTRRSKLRDTEAIINKFDTKYLPAQRKYLNKFPPEKHADMIIDNSNWEYPSIKYMRRYFYYIRVYDIY